MRTCVARMGVLAGISKCIVLPVSTTVLPEFRRMPVGDRESQPVVSELTAQERGHDVREEVEGGRDGWEGEKESGNRGSRRKRKMKARIT